MTTTQAQKRADRGLPPACVFCGEFAQINLLRLGDTQQTPACLYCARFAIHSGPYVTEVPATAETFKNVRA